ncbi:MAG: pyridoxamine 5'-phosphate oxidase family protein [Haloarculaceae archaeon]
MSEPSHVEMDTDERDRFLGTGGTGVLSFATGGEQAPHSIPVSYGYDARGPAFFFRLASEPDSEKAPLFDHPVSFVVYRETDDGWKSVEASGDLERTTDEDIATETLDGLDRVEIPYVDMFERPLRMIDFEFFRLRPAEITGRREDPQPE